MFKSIKKPCLCLINLIDIIIKSVKIFLIKKHRKGFNYERKF